jgi:uncharacterized phage protein (TIGR01671 family)
MREIKFRAWDKNNKGFINGFNMIGFSTGQGAPYRKLARFSTQWNEDDFELMQFTGFIDINGIESYENDIVKDGTGKVFVIRRIGGTGTQPHSYGSFTQFQCCTPCKDGKWSIAPKVSFHGMKVLGNTCQNPELLESGV